MWTERATELAAFLRCEYARIAGDFLALQAAYAELCEPVEGEAIGGPVLGELLQHVPAELEALASEIAGLIGPLAEPGKDRIFRARSHRDRRHTPSSVTSGSSTSSCWSPFSGEHLTTFHGESIDDAVSALPNASSFNLARGER